MLTGKNPAHIFFIGIGGISMSALAKLAISYGLRVSGSDITSSNLTRNLEQLGARIFYSHSKSNLDKTVDTVVFSGAIKTDNTELLEAKKRGIKIFSRAQFLGAVCKNYDCVIAVSGMHGKTTTTAMIASVLLDAGHNPTIHIGGELHKIGGNIHIGGREIFVTEACEYMDSFLEIPSTISVITNIEREHMDYFKTLSHIKSSFNTFAKNSKICFINNDFSHLLKSKKLITFGTQGEIYALNITLKNNGCYSFDVFKKDKFLGNVQLSVAGYHNVLNALACIGVCLHLGVPFDIIKNSISRFENAERRLQCICTSPVILHDYAHHPTEILTTINTVKDTYKLPIVCIFQPHTYSRTKTLFKKFLSCFNVDTLYIIDTYPAREKYDYMGSSARLSRALKKQNIETKNNKINNIYGSLSKAQFLQQFDVSKYKTHVILFLGAGDIDTLAHTAAHKN